MPTPFDRQLQLGADTVIGRDQQRIDEPCRLQVEKPAKSAKVCVGPRPPRRFGERADRADQRVARSDRNAGIGIGLGPLGRGGRRGRGGHEKRC